MNLIIVVFLTLLAPSFAGVINANECEQPELLHLQEQLKLIKYGDSKGGLYYDSSAEALQALFQIDEVTDEICDQKDCERGFREVVKKLYDCKNIDKIIYNHLKRLDRKIDYTHKGLKINEKKSDQKKISRLPPMDDYIKKLNSLNELRLKKLGTIEIDQDLEFQLKKAYFRKEQGIKRLSPRESVLYNYSRIQIAHLSSILVEHIKTMNAQSAFIEITQQDGAIKRIQISREDMYRMSIKLLDVRLDGENRKGIIKDEGTSYGDLIVAALITGDLAPEVVKAIMELPEMDENHVSTLDKIKSIGAQLGRTALIINPVTASYATVGFIIFESIKRKKAYEKNMANKSHIF